VPEKVGNEFETRPSLMQSGGKGAPEKVGAGWARIKAAFKVQAYCDHKGVRRDNLDALLRMSLLQRQLGLGWMGNQKIAPPPPPPPPFLPKLWFTPTCLRAGRGVPGAPCRDFPPRMANLFKRGNLT